MKKLLTALALTITTLSFSYGQQNITQGGTGWATSTLGDLFVGTTSKIRYTRLPVGTTGQILSPVGGQPAWVATSSIFPSVFSYTGTYPIQINGSVISSGFSTSTLNVFNLKQTFANASSTSFTGDTLYSTTGIFGTGAFSSTLNVTGKTTLGIASTTAVSATNFYGGTYSGAIMGTTGTFSSTLDVTGKTTLGLASSTAVSATDFYGGNFRGAVIGTTGSFSSTLDITGKTTFTNASGTSLTSTTLYSTNIYPAGITGLWLATDLNGKVVSTSTFPAPTLTGGINGFLTRWTSSSAISTGLLRDNGTVSGVNATSSTVTFNIQGNTGTNDIVSVASSTGFVHFKVANTGIVTHSTTTLNGDLTMNGKIIARVVGYTSSATLTVNLDTTDIATTTINQTTAIANPIGTAVDGQMFEIIAMATGTRTLTWGTNFASSTDLAQVYTVASGTTRFLFEYRAFGSVGAKFDLVGLLKVYP